MLVDSGVGSDLNDISLKITKINRLMDKDMKAAKQELENLKQSLFLISEETNLRHLSFAVLVHSINGERVHDLSDENVKRILAKLSDVKRGFFEGIINSLKKKVDFEISLYFPGKFDDAKIKEYYDQLKRKVSLQLDNLINDTDNESAIDKIEAYLVTFSKPKNFSGKDSEEILYDKQFDAMCLFLKKEMSVDVEDMTVLQFYNAFEYLKKLRKANKNGR